MKISKILEFDIIFKTVFHRTLWNSDQLVIQVEFEHLTNEYFF